MLRKTGIILGLVAGCVCFGLALLSGLRLSAWPMAFTYAVAGMILWTATGVLVLLLRQ